MRHLPRRVQHPQGGPNEHDYHNSVDDILRCPPCARLLWEHIERIQRTHERETEPQPA